MAVLVAAALLAAGLQAPMFVPKPVHPRRQASTLTFASQQRAAARGNDTQLRTVCGMPMVIADASFDRGILMGRQSDETAEVPEKATPNKAEPNARPNADADGQCGSVRFVRPVKR